jgi:hypothetical protein
LTSSNLVTGALVTPDTPGVQPVLIIADGAKCTVIRGTPVDLSDITPPLVTGYDVAQLSGASYAFAPSAGSLTDNASGAVALYHLLADAALPDAAAFLAVLAADTANTKVARASIPNYVRGTYAPLAPLASSLAASNLYSVAAGTWSTVTQATLSVVPHLLVRDAGGQTTMATRGLVAAVSVADRTAPLFAGFTSSVAAARAVQLPWPAATDGRDAAVKLHIAAYLVDPGSALTAEQVKAGTGAFTPVSRVSLPDATYVTSYTYGAGPLGEAQLADGKAHHFRAVAEDAAGNLGAVRSLSVTTLDVTPPTFVAFAKGTPTSSTVPLSWTAVTDNADVAPDVAIAAYSALQPGLTAAELLAGSSAGGGTAGFVSSVLLVDGASVASFAYGAGSLSEPALVQGSTYHLYAVARDASGNTSSILGPITASIPDVVAPTLAAITAATATTLVYDSVVPATTAGLMTDNTGTVVYPRVNANWSYAGSDGVYTVTASGELYNSRLAWQLFDKSSLSTWFALLTSAPAWAQVRLPVAQVVTSFVLVTDESAGAAATLNRQPKAYSFIGVSDAGAETVLYSTAAEAAPALVNNQYQIAASFTNAVAYRSYKLSVTACQSGSYLQIGELQLYGSSTASAVTLTASGVSDNVPGLAVSVCVVACLSASAPASLTAADVFTGATGGISGFVARQTFSVAAGASTAAHSFGGLTEGARYKFFAAPKDAAGNLGPVVTAAKLVDATAPQLLSADVLDGVAAGDPTFSASVVASDAHSGRLAVFLVVANAALDAAGATAAVAAAGFEASTSSLNQTAYTPGSSLTAPSLSCTKYWDPAAGWVAITLASSPLLLPHVLLLDENGNATCTRAFFLDSAAGAAAHPSTAYRFRASGNVVSAASTVVSFSARLVLTAAAAPLTASGIRAAVAVAVADAVAGLEASASLSFSGTTGASAQTSLAVLESSRVWSSAAADTAAITDAATSLAPHLVLTTYVSVPDSAFPGFWLYNKDVTLPGGGPTQRSYSQSLVSSNENVMGVAFYFNSTEIMNLPVNYMWFQFSKTSTGGYNTIPATGISAVNLGHNNTGSGWHTNDPISYVPISQAELDILRQAVIDFINNHATYKWRTGELVWARRYPAAAVADVTAPSFASLSLLAAASATAQLSWGSVIADGRDAAPKLHVAAFTAAQASITAATVKSSAAGAGGCVGKVAVTAAGSSTSYLFGSGALGEAPLADGKEHWFYAFAEDAAGNGSAVRSVGATTLDVTAPTFVSFAVGTPTTAAVPLSWTAVTDNADAAPDVAIAVFSSAQAGITAATLLAAVAGAGGCVGKVSLADGKTATGLTFGAAANGEAALSPGTAYYFYAVAQDAGGNKSAVLSATATTVAPAPSVASFSSDTVTTSSVALKWAAPAASTLGAVANPGTVVPSPYATVYAYLAAAWPASTGLPTLGASVEAGTGFLKTQVGYSTVGYYVLKQAGLPFSGYAALSFKYRIDNTGSANNKRDYVFLYDDNDATNTTNIMAFGFGYETVQTIYTNSASILGIGNAATLCRYDATITNRSSLAVTVTNVATGAVLSSTTYALTKFATTTRLRLEFSFQENITTGATRYLGDLSFKTENTDASVYLDAYLDQATLLAPDVVGYVQPVPLTAAMVAAGSNAVAQYAAGSNVTSYSFNSLLPGIGYDFYAIAKTGATFSSTFASAASNVTTAGGFGLSNFAYAPSYTRVWPPAALTADSCTLSGQTYGNGAYIATSSGTYSGTWPTWNAFDNNTSVRTSWVSTNNTVSGAYITIQLPTAIKLSGFSLTTYFGGTTSLVTYNYGPKSYTLIGMVGTTETTLLTVTNQVWGWATPYADGNTAGTTGTVSVNSTVAYNKYKILVSSIVNGSTSYVLIDQWTLYESVDNVSAAGTAASLSWSAPTVSSALSAQPVVAAYRENYGASNLVACTVAAGKFAFSPTLAGGLSAGTTYVFDVSDATNAGQQLGFIASFASAGGSGSFPPVALTATTQTVSGQAVGNGDYAITADNAIYGTYYLYNFTNVSNMFSALAGWYKPSVVPIAVTLTLVKVNVTGYTMSARSTFSHYPKAWTVAFYNGATLVGTDTQSTTAFATVATNAFTFTASAVDKVVVTFTNYDTTAADGLFFVGGFRLLGTSVTALLSNTTLTGTPGSPGASVAFVPRAVGTAYSYSAGSGGYGYGAAVPVAPAVTSLQLYSGSNPASGALVFASKALVSSSYYDPTAVAGAKTMVASYSTSTFTANNPVYTTPSTWSVNATTGVVTIGSGATQGALQIAAVNCPDTNFTAYWIMQPGIDTSGNSVNAQPRIIHGTSAASLATATDFAGPYVAGSPTALTVSYQGVVATGTVLTFTSPQFSVYVVRKQGSNITYDIFDMSGNRLVGPTTSAIGSSFTAAITPATYFGIGFNRWMSLKTFGMLPGYTSDANTVSMAKTLLGLGAAGTSLTFGSGTTAAAFSASFEGGALPAGAGVYNASGVVASSASWTSASARGGSTAFDTKGSMALKLDPTAFLSAPLAGFAASAWINISAASTDSTIINFWPTQASTGNSAIIKLVVNSACTQFFCANNVAGWLDLGLANIKPDGTHIKNTWNHWAVVADSVTGKVKCYFNGALLSTSSNSTWPVVTNVSNSRSDSGLLFGAYLTSDATTYLTALYDDIAVFAKALSAADVAALYSTGTAGTGDLQLEPGADYHFYGIQKHPTYGVLSPVPSQAYVQTLYPAVAGMALAYAVPSTSAALWSTAPSGTATQRTYKNSNAPYQTLYLFSPTEFNNPAANAYAYMVSVAGGVAAAAVLYLTSQSANLASNTNHWAGNGGDPTWAVGEITVSTAAWRTAALDSLTAFGLTWTTTLAGASPVTSSTASLKWTSPSVSASASNALILAAYTAPQSSLTPAALVAGSVGTATDPVPGAMLRLAFDDAANLGANTGSGPAPTVTGTFADSLSSGKFGKGIKRATGGTYSGTLTTPLVPISPNGVTVSFWIKMGSVPAASPSFLFGALANNLCVKWLTGGLTLQTIGNTASAASDFTISASDFSSSLNMWHNIVFINPYIASGPVNVLTYMDGVLKRTDSAGYNAGNSITHYNISLPTNATTLWLDVDLDDVRIYSRILSATEVSALYTGAGSLVSKAVISGDSGAGYSVIPTVLANTGLVTSVTANPDNPNASQAAIKMFDDDLSWSSRFDIRTGQTTGTISLTSTVTVSLSRPVTPAKLRVYALYDLTLATLHSGVAALVLKSLDGTVTIASGTFAAADHVQTGDILVAGNNFKKAYVDLAVNSSVAYSGFQIVITGRVGDGIALSGIQFLQNAGGTGYTLGAGTFGDAALAPLTTYYVYGAARSRYGVLSAAITGPVTVTTAAPVTINAIDLDANTAFKPSFAAVNGYFRMYDLDTAADSYGQIVKTGTFTMSFWIFMPSRTTGYPLTFRYHNGGTQYFGCALINFNSTTLFQSGIAGANSTDVTTQMTLNVWHHVAIASSSTAMKWYIDGALAGTHTATPVFSNFPASNPGQYMFFGADNQGTASTASTYFGGSIRNLHLKSTTMSLAEVEADRQLAMPQAADYTYYTSTLGYKRYPPAALTAATTTLTGQAYGNGAYTCVASSRLDQGPGTWPVYGAFDGQYGYTYSGWHTNLNTTRSSNPDWLTIEFPSAILLKGFFMESIHWNNQVLSRAPRDFKIYGVDTTTSAETLIATYTDVVNYKYHNKAEATASGLYANVIPTITSGSANDTYTQGYYLSPVMTHTQTFKKYKFYFSKCLDVIDSYITIQELILYCP